MKRETIQAEKILTSFYCQLVARLALMNINNLITSIVLFY